MKLILITMILATVAGTTRAQNGLTGTPATLSLGGNITAPITLDFNGSSTASFTIKKGTSNYFNIKNDGKIGIGTAVPNAALSIVSYDGGGILGIGNEASPTLAKIAEIYQGYNGNADAHGLKITRFQYANANVNLFGMQVSALSYNLGANILTNAFGIYSRAYQTGTGSITNAYSIYAESPTGVITNKWNLYANGTAANYFGGKVLIGANDLTKVGSYALAVNGDAVFNKIKVKLYAAGTGWADFVFDNNYLLMPLPELESYIRQNRRLPGIPSAEEVEKEGLDVGRNQALLLEKIEELTLHLIEQDKIIRQQKLLFENLVKKVESLSTASNHVSGD